MMANIEFNKPLNLMIFIGFKQAYIRSSKEKRNMEAFKVVRDSIKININDKNNHDRIEMHS
jgi:hypothetical protein